MSDPFSPARCPLLPSASVVSLAVGTNNTACAHATQENSTLSTTMPALQNQATRKPLSFNPTRLTGLSEALIRSHRENSCCGSVKAQNVAKKPRAQALADRDTPPFICNELKRERLLRTGSVALHDYYFDNMGGNGTAGAAAKYIDAFLTSIQWEAVAKRLESAECASKA